MHARGRRKMYVTLYMKNISRKYQIGVMGSCADLNYSKEIEVLAEQVGEEIAKAGATVLFGAEKDFDSLSSAACRGAKRFGGFVVGVTYGSLIDPVVEKQADVIVATGMGRGGGREFVLVSSCDAIITLGGGSGTLTEIAIAYQANIPIVSLKDTGGWSEKLANEFLDERKRVKVEVASNPKSAVELAVQLIVKRYEK